MQGIWDGRMSYSSKEYIGEEAAEDAGSRDRADASLDDRRCIS
jgi:hypothetical protein